MGYVREIILEVGTPAHTIVATADRISADLVVVGSHGYRGSESGLGGSADDEESCGDGKGDGEQNAAMHRCPDTQ